jgi:hypothetical protein
VRVARENETDESEEHFAAILKRVAKSIQVRKQSGSPKRPGFRVRLYAAFKRSVGIHTGLLLDAFMMSIPRWQSERFL